MSVWLWRSHQSSRPHRARDCFRSHHRRSRRLVTRHSISDTNAFRAPFTTLSAILIAYTMHIAVLTYVLNIALRSCTPSSRACPCQRPDAIAFPVATRRYHPARPPCTTHSMDNLWTGLVFIVLPLSLKRSRLTAIHEVDDLILCHACSLGGSHGSFLLFTPFINKTRILGITIAGLSACV